MSFHLEKPYLTTTRYGKSKRKLPNTAKLRESTAKHDAWLRKQGLHPEQRELKRALTGKLKLEMPDYSIEDTVALSNNLHVDGGRRTGIMANLHKEKPEVQKEILDKAARTTMAYNKGPTMYFSPESDTTNLGTQSRRG
jgi:hypothetical protein